MAADLIYTPSNIAALLFVLVYLSADQMLRNQQNSGF